MTSPAESGFSVTVDQNAYLPEGSGQVDAIVTVSSASGAGPVAAAPAQERVEILMIDHSGSMGMPTNLKMEEAKRATWAAIDAIPDGVNFAIIAGSHESQMVYPPGPSTARADAITRDQAKRSVLSVQPQGGTAIGNWLLTARSLAMAFPNALRHAILLTDGRNEHQTPAELQAAISACAGVFTCDCRGVGTDWQVAELRSVASALLGSVDIVAQPADLAADFQQMMTASLGKSLPALTLRLWTPAGAVVDFVKQVSPTVEDLTSRRVDSGPQRSDYPLGSWGAEERDYQVSITVTPAPVGKEKLAGRVSVLAGEVALGEGLIRALWTDDTALSARISRRVAHYTGQAELADAIQVGLAARKDGDIPTATAKLARAVELAEQSGNEGTAKLLANVVEVDRQTGTVRLRAAVQAADEMALDARSTKTARIRKEAGSSGPDSSEPVAPPPPGTARIRGAAPEAAEPQVSGTARIRPATPEGSEQ